MIIISLPIISMAAGNFDSNGKWTGGSGNEENDWHALLENNSTYKNGKIESVDWKTIQFAIDNDRDNAYFGQLHPAIATEGENGQDPYTKFGLSTKLKPREKAVIARILAKTYSDDTMRNTGSVKNTIAFARAMLEDESFKEKAPTSYNSFKDTYEVAYGKLTTQAKIDGKFREGEDLTDEQAEEKVEEDIKKAQDAIKREPKIRYTFGSADKDKEGVQTKSIGEIINDAKKIEEGKGGDVFEEGDIKPIADFLYNTVLAIGVAASVIIGGMIGIKLMTGSAEQKAETKQYIVPYIVGCVVIFGGLGIWKLVVEILKNAV